MRRRVSHLELQPALLSADTGAMSFRKLLIAPRDKVGLHLAQECFWYNPARLPASAEWVNVRRIRIKDSVEYI